MEIKAYHIWMLENLLCVCVCVLHQLHFVFCLQTTSSGLFSCVYSIHMFIWYIERSMLCRYTLHVPFSQGFHMSDTYHRYHVQFITITNLLWNQSLSFRRHDEHIWQFIRNPFGLQLPIFIWPSFWHWKQSFHFSRLWFYSRLSFSLCLAVPISLVRSFTFLLSPLFSFYRQRPLVNWIHFYKPPKACAVAYPFVLGWFKSSKRFCTIFHRFIKHPNLVYFTSICLLICHLFKNLASYLQNFPIG